MGWLDKRDKRIALKPEIKSYLELYDRACKLNDQLHFINQRLDKKTRDEINNIIHKRLSPRD